MAFLKPSLIRLPNMNENKHLKNLIKNLNIVNLIDEFESETHDWRVGERTQHYIISHSSQG